METHSFILLGKTGDGKSSLANLLSGTKKFNIFDGKGSGTTKIQKEDFSFENTNYIVIDTPGYFDSDKKRIQENEEKIINSIKDSKNPISAILLVVNFQQSRIDEPAQICVEKISELFPMEEFWKHIIIFTKYFSEYPEELVEQKRIWEKDINMFKRRIKAPQINNNIEIKTFYINNSKINLEHGRNLNIKKDILNTIKLINTFYSKQFTVEISKERVNLSFKNNEPDEKYGNIEKRLFRSYSQIVYELPNKTIRKGPIIEKKRWTERIEFYEVLEGIQKKK